MRTSTSRWLAIVAATSVSVGMAACASEPRAADGASETGAALERAGEPVGSEGAGEPQGAGEHARAEGGEEHARSEGRGEHGEEGEGGEHGSGEEGEESGVQIGRDDAWDATRNGARLILSFDPASNAFVGTVENTTQGTLCAVRVEVHLSTGTELGPTERRNLPSGETTAVMLPTEGEDFDTWTAHPEISRCRGE